MQSPGSSHFGYINEETAEQLSHGFIPRNTELNTKWVVTNFLDWTNWRKSKHPDDAVPENLFDANSTELDKWLSRYIAETRNKKGDLYTPSTLHQLLCGLYRHIKTIRTDCPNFVDKNNTLQAATYVHGTLDSLFRKLHENGIGRKVKHSEIISRDEEEKLWSSGQLGSKTPRALQNAIFFLNGKNSCIRGGEEHRSIKTSQFQRLHDPECYIYHEFVSKNRPGTFRKHVDAKVVPIYCQCEHTSRCHVHLLDLYIS